MKIGQLIKDKRVIYGGLGVAVVLGLVTLYARTKNGAGVAGDEGSGSAAGPGGQLNGQFPDTSGSNVASWFGQYSESVQRQLDQYRQEQLDAIAALRDVPTSPGRVVLGQRRPPRTGPIIGPGRDGPVIQIPRRG